MSGSQRTAGQDDVFERVLVGVDGTSSGFDACRQAAALAGPEAAIEAVAVVHLSDAIQVGLGGAALASDTLREEAVAALAEAVRIVGDRAGFRFVNGFAADAILREASVFGATALAIGSHGHRRATEILIGGVAGELLHSAPCSVLVARPRPEEEPFPGRIVAGTDGSADAEVAVEAATALAARLSVPLEIVVATRGRTVDTDLALGQTPAARLVDAHPVEALVDASRDAGLLVVGSRGLHGLRALGSVSERVAHSAACSVLVVRSRPQ